MSDVVSVGKRDVELALGQWFSDLLAAGFTGDDAAGVLAQSVMRKAWLIAAEAATVAGRTPDPSRFIDVAKRATCVQMMESRLIEGLNGIEKR